ncbi:predicted protein [Sclerotinia sclerotiorum 1980 UF-70]|uniref:Uncharacterized protein n=1 Tax=Sclerotinia sclerotiorum (strain ATCC 18683 / 1980 / Ss-1) TaxID=665079 RepID=A7EER9_SCLS1|nr:predicted protein [Sclerotinia sclerotiorum 1980 UF-70]EDO01335.1 predicted protein [Sclerotinia sclerotiorum 1980 UF-70]
MISSISLTPSIVFRLSGFPSDLVQCLQHFVKRIADACLNSRSLEEQKLGA